MQSEMRIPGIMAFMTEMTNVIPRRMRFLPSSLTITESIPKAVTAQERTATVMLALWQFM
jgi:hypothetical protein